MERATVSAATGALDPVLAKLAAFLDDERTLPGGSKSSDIILIRSELQRMRSLLLRIWWRGDLDAACKDWMTEARELSYDMEDAVDDLLQKRASEIPLEELKMRVKDVAERSCEEWTKAPETISNSSKQVVADPRSRFLHRDASALVGMEELRDELVELVVQGVDRQGDSSRRRIRPPGHATTGREQQIVMKVEMHCDKCRSKAMGLVASTHGVSSVAISGEGKDQVVVLGLGVDAAQLVSALRKKVGPTILEQVCEVEKPATVCEHPAAAHGNQRSNEIKTVCILGLAGGGKTTLAELVFQAAGEQFDFRVFVSVSPSHSITEILGAILTQVTNAPPYAGTGAVGDLYLIQQISNSLMHARYLIIIDGIWHWEEWEIIRKSLPKNNPGSRIIITTRINAIAEKCLTGDNDAIVYEIEALDYAGARILMQSVLPYIAGSNEDYRWDIFEICSGVPLAIICMSSAYAEQIQGVDGCFEQMRALRRIEDGILNIASLKPLAESLCLGYNDLPLHLKFFLLYCSIYSWHHKFEKDRLVMRWIAERFVYEEEVAEGYFDDLVNREWIKPTGSGKYKIHPMMLAFLRCKSQEDNLITCLDFRSDFSSSKQIRRLSLQVKDGDSVDISRMDLSHTRSLILFGSASAVPFKQFERLRVLELEDVKDLKNAHLVDICGLLWLSHLGLKGVPITELPPEIARLLLLETLDIRDTGVTELPWEAGQLPKTVRVLSGDNDCHQVIMLPEGLCQALENGIPPSSLGKCREVLSILLFDRFGVGTVPPEVGVFKVPGRRMGIPQLIKDHFKVLSSLDIRLFTLEEDDLKFLQEMPNLKTLVVRFEVVPIKPVSIGGAGFTMLESFCVDSRVPRVTFVPGAMLKLKRLVFKFYAGPASEDPVGITHLQNLEVVVFRCSPWYRSNSLGISATVSVVRREAREHPNRITLFINDMEETFPEKQSAHVCRGDAGRREAGEHSNRITLNISDKEEILPDKQSALVCHGDASSSWTSGIAAEEADILCAHRSSLDGNDAIASCSRPSEIEEVYAQ